MESARRKDSYVLEDERKFGHLIDRRPKIDYLETHDDDIAKIIKEILRIENEKYEERQKNERNDSTSGDN